MAGDKSSAEIVEVVQPSKEDGISTQRHTENDAEDVDARDLKHIEVTLATITVTHKPKLFSKGMLRLWGIVLLPCGSHII